MLLLSTRRISCVVVVVVVNVRTHFVVIAGAGAGVSARVLLSCPTKLFTKGIGLRMSVECLLALFVFTVKELAYSYYS